MEIIPIRELKNTVEIEKRCAEANGPVFITKNGYGRLVVMDIEYFDKTFRQIYEAKAVNDGINDMNSGKIKDAESVFGNMKEKYGF